MEDEGWSSEFLALDHPLLGMQLERLGLVILTEVWHGTNVFLDAAELERADCLLT